MSDTLQAVIDALPEFRRQDDYLLAHGASLMSEDSHEIIHIDTMNRIVAASTERLERECAELRKQCSLLREQRDAWKTEAEHQYGLLRAEILDELDYPVTGALDTYAAGKYSVLKAEPPL